MGSYERRIIQMNLPYIYVSQDLSCLSSFCILVKMTSERQSCSEQVEQ